MIARLPDLTAVFSATSASTREGRAGWLRALGRALERERAELVGIAEEETRLGAARLDGEITRTADQLGLFADVLEEGSYLEATIDHARADATPPRPDLRRMLRPIGPVAVFAASNFPFAFSVLGGDTASALAAGCPVVVKAHPGHPRLGRRVAEVGIGALAAAGAPPGTLSIVSGHEEGVALVTHPAIRAVGFTGSTAGGRALSELAASRSDPIPFYGELGSINPVVLSAAALTARADALADGLAASFTLGAGQFCTKPGLVLVPVGSDFAERVAERVAGSSAAVLLTPSIAAGFAAGVERFAASDDARVLSGGADARATVVATTVQAVLADPGLFVEECFGPLTVVVEGGTEQADRVLALVSGSLTATVHAEPEEDLAGLVTLLADHAGRVIVGG